MRFIVAFLLIAGFAPSVYAAGPNASIKTDANKRYVYVTLSNLRDVAKIDYTVTYTTGTRQQGFVGGAKIKSRTLSMVKRQILGTCSSLKCVYHPNVKNIQLDATFTLKNGGKTNVSKSL